MWHLNSNSQEVFVKMVSELGFVLWMGILISLCVLSSVLSQWQTSLIDHSVADITNWSLCGRHQASQVALACQCRRCKKREFNPWAWKIPWRRAWQPTPVFFPWPEEPGGLQFIGSQRVGHDWAQHTPATGLLEHKSLHSDPENPGVPAGSVCLKTYFKTQKRSP